MNPAFIFGWLPLIGVVIGLARARFPRLPLIATGVLVVLYAAYVRPRASMRRRAGTAQAA